jgi:hypothetical protein
VSPDVVHVVRPRPWLPVWLRGAPVTISAWAGFGHYWNLHTTASGGLGERNLATSESRNSLLLILPTVLTLHDWAVPLGSKRITTILEIRSMLREYTSLDDVEKAAWTARNRAIRKRWQKTGKYTL